jgi:Flp pilus assembly protein TadG
MTSAMQCIRIGCRPRAITQASRRVLADRAGATMVEFAIAASLFLLLILGIVEAGRGLWTINALNYAVQQAARCASINATACGNQTDIQAYAIHVSAALVPNATFSVDQYSDYSCTTTTAVAAQVRAKRVSASDVMRLHIPFVPMQPTLTASSCFPVK